MNSMGSNKPRRRTVDDELTHPLLGDVPTLQLLTPRDEVGAPRALQQLSVSDFDRSTTTVER